MARVIVRIFHVDPGSGAGPFVRLLADARRENGLRRVDAFRAAGADEVELVAGPPDDTPFGRRLAELLAATQPAGRVDGIVVLGSGALPLATPRDHRSFVTAAGSRTRSALANNQYSADAIAISMPGALPPIPSMTADNALPRWLAERAGWAVTDLRGRWRLAVDLDSPLDVELVRPGALPAAVAVPMRDRRAAIRRAFHDRKAEVLVTGRTSAATLAWLERHTASRVRALVEERGLRAADPLAEVDPPASRGRPPTASGLSTDGDRSPVGRPRPRREAPRGDRRERADHVRALHGRGARRPGAGLLRRVRRASHPLGRLSLGPGAPPRLRCDHRPRPRRGLAGSRAAGSLPRARVRGRERTPGAGHARRPPGDRLRAPRVAALRGRRDRGAPHGDARGAPRG